MCDTCVGTESHCLWCVLRMNRDPDHCKEFLLSELGTTGNMDGQGSLIIRGKFQTKSVTSILRRYISSVSVSLPRVYVIACSPVPLVVGSPPCLFHQRFPHSPTRHSLTHTHTDAYVVCEMCRSLDTTLSRDSATRLHRLYCENCGASRSVAAINKMFTAVIRRPRK